MAIITAQPASGNTALTYTAASVGGDTVAVATSRRVTVLIRNASASPITLTLTAVSPCSQGFLHPVAVSCAVGDTETLIPPQCIDPNGNIGVTYSAVTSVTVAAITS